MNFLIIALIVLAVVTVVQILRVFELSGKINNEDINLVTEQDNDRQGKYLLAFSVIFLGSCIAMTIGWWDLLLPYASSVHGEKVDNLMAISMVMISVVFLITQPVLFYFSYKYRGINGRKATFYAHNTKLELIWTVIPALALTVLISYGLYVWNGIMDPENKDSIQIEVYAKQFDWTARYSGADNKLGRANVRMVNSGNMVGLISTSAKDARIASIDEEIAMHQQKIAESKNAIKNAKREKTIESLRAERKTVIALELQTTPADLKSAEDDIIVKELHLPVGKQVQLNFRSQDIIHSAFLPHFRVQMNCVPGAHTQFIFTPTQTTAEMREQEKNPEFDYILLCNKICGAAHYNMQMKVIVESEEDYNKWLSEQKTLTASLK
jgi:cytochrome c oxidase subunit 2